MRWRRQGQVLAILFLGFACGGSTLADGPEVSNGPGFEVPPGMDPARAMPSVSARDEVLDSGGSIGNRVAEHRSAEVPGRLIVGLADSVEACAEMAFGSPRGTGPVVEGLVSTLAALGVSEVDSLFRSDAESAALAAGGRIPLAALRAHHRARAAKVLGRRGKSVDGVELPPIHHVYVLSLEPGSEKQTATVLAALDSVLWVEPVKVYQAATLPDDAFVDPDGGGEWRAGSWGQDYPDQWALESMAWGEVWSRRATLWPDAARIGGGGVTIAVVDTGIDDTHPDLAGNLWQGAGGSAGADFVDIDTAVYAEQGYLLVAGEDYRDPDDDPRDRQGHGTHVAGIAAATADDTFGIAGVAWNATLLGVRAGFAVGFENGGTTGLFETDDLAAAISWAAEAGADILNFSWGGSSSEVIAAAVAYAHSLGALTVAAAGNSDDEVRHQYPANLPGVLSVGASDPGGGKASFSNWGGELDLAAPGKDILSLRAVGTELSSADQRLGSYHIRASGTSMSTPMVAGAAALVWSAMPDLTAGQVAARLRGTATPFEALLPGREAEISFGAGSPHMLHALEAPRRPRGVLSTLLVDPWPISTSDGNGSAEAGETVDLLISLVNVWQAAGAITFELVGIDPHVEVVSSSSDYTSWPEDSRLHFVPRIAVAPEAPRYHRPALQLRVTGDGFEQLIDFPLVVNGSRTQVVAYEDWPAEYIIELSVASDAEGGLVAVWNRFVFEGEKWLVMGRLFDPAGRPLGEPFLLHPDDGLPRGNPRVARSASGEWAAVWRTFEQVAENEYRYTVEARRFDAAGQPIGDLMVVEAEGESVTQMLAVAIADSGTVAAGWWASSFGVHEGIRVAVFGPEGQLVRDVFNAQTTDGSHSSPSLAFDGQDRLLVAWRAHLGLTAEGQHDINAFARLYDSSGTALGGEMRLNEEKSRFNLGTQASGSDAGFVVTWDWCDRPTVFGGTGLCSARGRRLSSQGEPLTGELVLEPVLEHDADDVVVAMDDEGRFGVAWEACLPSGFVLGGCEIRSRAFDSDGSVASGLHRIDHLNPLHNPSLALARDGYFVTWDHSGYGPFDIEGQFFIPPGLSPGETDVCGGGEDQLCLAGERFEVEVSWRDFAGRVGKGEASPLSDDSGYFSFFDPDNVEILVKVLDGRSNNGHWWVFFASLSNVEYQMTVRDRQTGAERVYDNPLGRFASGADTEAFADSSGAGVAPFRAKEDSPVLALQDGRFSVHVTWTDFAGNSGDGVAVPLTDDSGSFWFFGASNVELVVKVLDGRAFNGHWWVFYGAMSNVAYTLTVTDTVTGESKVIDNPAGRFASGADTEAFAASSGGS